MVMAYSISNVLFLLVWHLFTRQLSGLSLIQLMKDVGPFFLIATIIMAGTYLLTRSITALWLLLLVRILVAGTAYLLALKLLHAEILNECMQYARGLVKKKK